jgi:hypothetical protein
MKKIFDEEKEKFIRENAKGIRNEKLTELFNEHFKTNVKVGQIKKFKNYHHISSGFKSCNLPIGTERENKGYILVKVKEPNIWIEKHRLIYEKVHGSIPDGYRVMFADKNKKNFDIDNLILVTDEEKLIMNHNKLIYEESEFTKAGLMVAKLIKKTNTLKRKK